MRIVIEVPEEMDADVLLAFGDGTAGSIEKVTGKVTQFIATAVSRRRAATAAQRAVEEVQSQVQQAFGVELPERALGGPGRRHS